MGLGWYVARTEPRAEFLAANELSRDGYEIFFPRVKSVYPRVGHADMPLFPGYLFLRCDPDADGWPSFRRIHRILGWVGFGGEVPCLPDEVVIDMKERLESINNQGGVWRRFEAGEKVRVVSHTMEGLAEVVEVARSPQSRVKVLLQFMGRLIQVQVPWENLRSIDVQTWEKQRFPRRTRGKGRWIRSYGPRPVPSI
jgi:transcriptional antiterminator RfaH